MKNLRQIIRKNSREFNRADDVLTDDSLGIMGNTGNGASLHLPFDIRFGDDHVHTRVNELVPISQNDSTKTVIRARRLSFIGL